MSTWAAGTFSPYQQQKPPSEPGKGQSDAAGQDQDDIHAEIEKKLGKREEIGSNEEAAEKEEKSSNKPGGPSGKPGKAAIGDLESRKAEIDAIKPRMNWKSIISLMVSSSVEKIDTSYARPSRRGLTGVAIAAQTGAGAIKPGERIEEEKQNKILLVLDTSGSMYNAIPKALAEVKQLLIRAGKSSFPITVCFFASGSKWYQINLGHDTWGELDNIADAGKTLPRDKLSKGWQDLISKASTGGTEFDGKVVDWSNQLLSQGYNMLLISDTDMLYGSNWSNFLSLYNAHKSSVFWICDEVSTFRAAVKQLGQVPRTWTSLD